MLSWTLLTHQPAALAAQPGPTPAAPAGWFDGWFGDYLRNPDATLSALIGTLRDWAIDHAPDLILALTIAAVVEVAARRWWAWRCHRRLLRDARLVTVLAPPTVDPAGGQALWSNLVGLLRPGWRRALSGQPHLACEYVFSESGVEIRLWVPGVIPPDLVERAVEAAWPGAHTHTTPAAPPLPDPGPRQRRIVVGGQLRLARSEALPLRTDFDTDPIRALLGAPVGLGRGEHACVQILARPVTGQRVAAARHAARRAARRLHHRGPNVVGHLLDLLTPATKPARTRTAAAPGRVPTNPQTSLEQSAHNRATVAKQRGPQYATVIRYAAATLLADDTTAQQSATAAQQSATAREVARGRAHALAAAFATYTEHNRYNRHRLHRPGPALAARRLGRGDLLSVPELAALAHLPTDLSVPGLRRAGARALAPPPGIVAPSTAAKPLGVTDAGHPRPVALRVPDARHHLHVIGATGSGKSTLLGNMILADADAGRGIVLIDPKGDLVTDLLSRLPRTAADRVVLFDADSRHRPPRLNPLDGGQTHLTVDNLVSVFRRVYSAFWEPRTDDVMRAACLTLRTQHAVPTLAELPKLLTEPAFRGRVTAGVDDPVLRGFWTWYEQLTDANRAQVVAPLLNKLRAFLLRPFVRDAIAAGASTVDMHDILDGGICLVRIPKGSLGEETTRLVGSLIVAATWQATTARAHTPQRLRRDASLVIDECQNFLNLPYPIEDMLAEARGFRLSLTLAHQHLGQLTPPLRDGIAANARNKVFFALSPEDAGHLARHTLPELGAHDLAHLDGFHAAARLITDGAPARAFTLTTRPLPPAPRTSTPPAPTPNAPPRTPSRTPNRTPSRAPNTGHPPRRPGRPAPSTPDRFDPRLAARPHSPDPRSSGPRSSGPRSPGPRAARPPQNPSPWR